MERFGNECVEMAMHRAIKTGDISQHPLPPLPQGKEETLQLEPVNGYYRRLQYQYLGSRGSPGAAGFVVEVHDSCVARAVGSFSFTISCMTVNSHVSGRQTQCT